MSLAAAKSLLGKTAIVTGSSSGFGRAIAILFAQAGANVVCSDLASAARSTGYENDFQIPTHKVVSKKPGGKSFFKHCDTSESSQVESLVDAAVKEFGRIDIMVNNAGIFTGLKNIVEEPDEDYLRTMAVNANGVYFGCKHAIRQFLVQQESVVRSRSSADNGKVINIASMGGLIGLAREPSYCASKGAVVNLTRQLAIDFGKCGINVNAICPGYMATAMVRPFIDNPELNQSLHAATPWPRLGTAEDVANVALFLASSDSDFITGTTITTDGGVTAK
jgi:NAD(P)-dependent dehydrogenase (short-subunit alcohol dehydrogenase family)